VLTSSACGVVHGGTCGAIAIAIAILKPKPKPKPKTQMPMQQQLFIFLLFVVIIMDGHLTQHDMTQYYSTDTALTCNVISTTKKLH
jgi:hypothetical protein